MKKIYLLPLSLNIILLHTNQPHVANTVIAIYDKHKEAIIIRPEYRMMEQDLIFNCPEEPIHIIYGDGFSVDTWDNKLKSL